VRDLAKGMLIKERTTLEGLKRALRKLKVEPVIPPPAPRMSVDIEVNGGIEADATIEVNGSSSEG